jgi:hypothetical protein
MHNNIALWETFLVSPSFEISSVDEKTQHCLSITVDHHASFFSPSSML